MPKVLTYHGDLLKRDVVYVYWHETCGEMKMSEGSSFYNLNTGDKETRRLEFYEFFLLDRASIHT